MDEYDVRRLALILSVQAEIEGMKAFNKSREIEGNAIGYNQENFNQLANKLESLAYAHNEHLFG